MDQIIEHNLELMRGSGQGKMWSLNESLGRCRTPDGRSLGHYKFYHLPSGQIEAFLLHQYLDEDWVKEYRLGECREGAFDMAHSFKPDQKKVEVYRLYVNEKSIKIPSSEELVNCSQGAERTLMLTALEYNKRYATII